MAETFGQQLERLRQITQVGFGSEVDGFGTAEDVIALSELLRRWDALHDVEHTRKCSGCQVVEPRAFFVGGQRKCEACYNMGSR